ncbi:MAG: FadR/GntR family transcriptional regulator [Tropicimonas sp.]|uniref:FadR/GntR family transcriptional regulator n=1 Tax=Tropicimonas sp. TaxID=2067044 RepID=UPI003A8C8414
MTLLDLPKRGRRYLEIAEALAARIEAGEYATGQRLPPERDLAQALDVSRTTLREALLALEIMRFVEIRTGSGVIVLPEHQRDRKRGELIISDEVGPYEVLEVRRTIEGLSAYHAASRATTEQLDELERIVARTEAAINDVSVFDRADEEYHARIAQATGNGVLELYADHLWRMRRGALCERWFAQTRKVSTRRQSVEEHWRILRALQRRRPEIARSAMEQHIDVLIERFLDQDLLP